jgi:hypothetical protein
VDLAYVPDDLDCMLEFVDFNQACNDLTFRLKRYAFQHLHKNRESTSQPFILSHSVGQQQDVIIKSFQNIFS